MRVNKMMDLTVRRINFLVAAGAAVLVEGPLMSYLRVLKEMAGLTGCSGPILMRCDQCALRTPLQKPQLWLTTCSKLVGMAGVCTRKLPHPRAANRTRENSLYASLSA